MSETQPGVDDVTPLSDQSDSSGGETDHDQDSEPSLNAPEEERPDGLQALAGDDSDDSESTGGDGSPS